MSSNKRLVLVFQMGYAVVPPNLSPKRDLATRVTVASDSRMYARCAQRKLRASVCVKRKQSDSSRVVDHLNDACRMMVAKKPPSWQDDRRLLQIYNNVHAQRPLVYNASCCDLYCVVCRASESKFCHCGAGLFVKQEELDGFVAFIKSPRNTILHYLDPKDQESILTTLRNIGYKCAPELLRVLCIFAMISNGSVMEDIGKRVKVGADLDTLFRQRAKDGLATFRGGQFAGSITVAQLGKFVTSFMAALREELCPLLLQWSQVGKSKIKCVKIVRQILEGIHSCRVSGFGPYKKKRFAEFLVLVGIGGIWGHFDETWIIYLSDVWPFPTNSASMLKRIFPRIKTKQRRGGIVALLRCLRHHKHFNFSTVIAHLCFWSEQENGRINWM